MSELIEIRAQDVADNAAHLGITLLMARCEEIVAAVTPTLARVRGLSHSGNVDLCSFENLLFSLQRHD